MGVYGYRISSYGKGIAAFGRFNSIYGALGRARVLASGAGVVGPAATAVGIINDYNSMQSGEIGSQRFAYRVTGGLATLGASTYVGAQFGGPWGAVVGAAESLTVSEGEDGYMYWHNKMSENLGNIEKGLNSCTWMPNGWFR
ncbi:hypothetical protein LL912_03630 [Niabella sp. CC-SYL272]|uniref:hypothetical protein n=1 Tax=Niabella agricola TaxID=2891571 RepID=UPI001F3AC149|nr:hypothetical protein [Niabella agricola]MCF3107861.1 hypothetical protein [Niabella agricola]